MEKRKIKNPILMQVDEIEVDNESKYDDFYFEEFCCRHGCELCRD